jgi:membrane protein DedA with SNARE-associated domain
MHLIHEYGLVAVAAIIGLECLGLPIPGETALLVAAIYAGTKRDLNINAVIVTAAGAAIVGPGVFEYPLCAKRGNRLEHRSR